MVVRQVEQFFHAISAVPRVELRLKCWQTTLTLDDSMAVLRDKISLMQRGATAVKGCKGFLKVLEVSEHHMATHAPRALSLPLPLESVQGPVIDGSSPRPSSVLVVR